MKKTAIARTIASRSVYPLVRWSLALIFLYAGITKLFDPRSFAVIIDAYGLIPESWNMPVAILLPLLEVVAAIGLIFDIRGSLGTIAALLVLFMAILGYGIHMGLDVDCGCFSPDDPEGQAFSSIRPAFYRDMVMMAVILFLYGWRYFKSIQPIRLKFSDQYYKCLNLIREKN